VPGRRTWCTVLGAGTLYGYLLHGFVAQSARFWGWYDPAWVRGPVGEVVVTLVAAAVMTALCGPFVQRAFRCVMEPGMEWAFSGREPSLSRAGKDTGTEQGEPLTSRTDR
jgi:hypothetical protein